ncbi:hypothetical protein JCM10908_000552 [Rhodotorula pacifica]|uniref:uncharacterized protein n=1 Tax=Rhodotorula pacifica TaxID=1495444 RepID=UPI003170C1F3
MALIPSSSKEPAQTHSRKQRHASPHGLLGKLGLAQPTLHLSLVEDVVYLHPAPEGPTHDEFVRGTVTLYLPKPRTLKHLIVRLVGEYSITWPDVAPYESGTCLDRSVSLLDDGEEIELDRGEHIFTFSLIVPATAACYERCQYGRVRHTISATAEGLGPVGSDIASKQQPILFIVNPGLAETSRPPPPLTVHVEDIVDEVGPCSMTMQSQHCMVGGLLMFRLQLPFPPLDLFVFAIRVKILQRFHLQSPTDETRTARPPPTPETVFKLEAAHPPNDGRILEPRTVPSSETHRPLQILQKNEAWSVRHLARFPPDSFLRPTTFHGTVTPISVSHMIQMEMVYRPMTNEEIELSSSDSAHAAKSKGKDAQSEKRRLVMSKPLEIFSCHCFLDSLTLPEYSEAEPTPLDSELKVPCVCKMSLQRLVERQGKSLFLSENDMPTEDPDAMKADGQHLSPTAHDTAQPPRGPVAAGPSPRSAIEAEAPRTNVASDHPT